MGISLKEYLDEGVETVLEMPSCSDWIPSHLLLSSKDIDVTSSSVGDAILSGDSLDDIWPLHVSCRQSVEPGWLTRLSDHAENIVHHLLEVGW